MKLGDFLKDKKETVFPQVCEKFIEEADDHIFLWLILADSSGTAE